MLWAALAALVAAVPTADPVPAVERDALDPWLPAALTVRLPFGDVLARAVRNKDSWRLAKVLAHEEAGDSISRWGGEVSEFYLSDAERAQLLGMLEGSSLRSGEPPAGWLPLPDELVERRWYTLGHPDYCYFPGSPGIGVEEYLVSLFDRFATGADPLLLNVGAGDGLDDPLAGFLSRNASGVYYEPGDVQFGMLIDNRWFS
jgi:hypothetical protein